MPPVQLPVADSSVFSGMRVHPSPMPEIVHPANWYNNPAQNFTTSYWAITQPFFMEKETFWHDFDQCLYFAGGDALHMDELGGVVEFHLANDNGVLEKHIITKPTFVYVKAKQLHCPLHFAEIFDPAKPILFQDITFAGTYRRFRPGSTQPLNAANEPIIL